MKPTCNRLYVKPAPTESQHALYKKGNSIHRMMTVTALCLLLLLPVAAEAQIVAPPKAKSEIVVQGRLAPVETVSDSELESRLQAVFSHIDELKGIHTTVQDGVVTLSGKIVSSKSGQLAN